MEFIQILMSSSVRIRLPPRRRDVPTDEEENHSLERRILSPVRNEFAPRRLSPLDAAYIDEEDFFHSCGRSIESRRRDLKLEQKTTSQLERQHFSHQRPKSPDIWASTMHELTTECELKLSAN